MSQASKTAARAAESKFRKKTEEQKLETAGMMRWLLTYADMITLMLALFIILFAMSTISRVKVQEFAKQVSAGFDNVWTINQPPSGGANGSLQQNANASIPHIEQQLKQYVQKNKLQNRVQVHVDQRGLVVTLLSDKSFYDSGRAQMRPETQKILDQIAPFLKKNKNLIRVEGNTDNVPIHTAQYSSNWELSAQRAVNVVRYLQEKDGINPARLSAAGNGKYHPRTGNYSDQSKQQNRRVDIILLNANLSQLEGPQ